MRLTKSKEIMTLFYYWLGRLNLPYIYAFKDNRIDCTFAISEWDTKDIHLNYNTSKIATREWCALLSDVFHEIGHLKNKLPYKKESDIIESEYQAERYSVKMMRKHYPRDYGLLLERFIRLNIIGKKKKEEPLYYKAYKRIKDYRNTIKGDL